MIENMYDVKDKVAIVTGSSRGIGKQCALAFAEGGAKLVLNYVNNQEAAEITAEEVSALGSEAIIIQADVKDFEACQTLGEQAIKKYGKVDFLVNNAGINIIKPLNEVSNKEYNRLMSVNLSAPFRIAQSLIPNMKKQNYGRIINISSISGQYGGPRTVHYAVSKAGLITLGHCLARFGAPYNITCNNIKHFR